MNSLPADFWAGWVVALTVVSLGGLVWLVYDVYFGAHGAAADEVWDDTLREGATPAPLWWFWFIVALLSVTVVYLILYPGLGSYRGVLQWSQGARVAESAQRYEATFGAARRKIAAASLASLRRDPAALAAGGSIFRNNCGACHGEQGYGQANLFPDLTDSAWQWGGSEQAIEQTITQGRQAVMPPWQAALGDAGVDDMTTFVLGLARGAPPAGEAAEKFQMYCSACHGANGAGNPLLGAPALNDMVWLYGGSRDAVHASIANGRTGVMPPFGQRLDAAQIKLVAAWVAERSAAPAVASN
jgi:cytochrome c oxidase cbb3-type subunit 3